jgi:hypothetical protein
MKIRGFIQKFAATLITVALTFGGQPASADAAWQLVGTVTPADTKTGKFIDTKIASLPNSKQVAVWLEISEWTGQQIKSATLSKSGAVEAQKQFASIEADTAAIAAGLFDTATDASGRFYVAYSEIKKVWLEGSNPKAVSSVYLTSTIDGVNWTTPVTALSTATQECLTRTCGFVKVRLAKTAGGKFAVAALHESVSKLFVANSTDGAKWRESKIAEATGFCNLTLSASKESFVTTYRECNFLPAPSEVKFSAWTGAPTSAWSTPALLSKSDADSSMLEFSIQQAVVQDDGESRLFWLENTKTACSIDPLRLCTKLFTARFDSTTQKFGNPELIYLSYRSTQGLEVIRNSSNGALHVVWMEPDSSFTIFRSVTISENFVSNSKPIFGGKASRVWYGAGLQSDSTIALMTYNYDSYNYSEILIAPDKPAVEILVRPIGNLIFDGSRNVAAHYRTDGTAFFAIGAPDTWQTESKLQFWSRGKASVSYTPPKMPTIPVVKPTKPRAMQNATLTGVAKVGSTLTAGTLTFRSKFGISQNQHQWFSCKKRVAEADIVLAASCLALPAKINRELKIDKSLKGRYLLVAITNVNKAGATIEYSKSTEVVK